MSIKSKQNSISWKLSANNYLLGLTIVIAPWIFILIVRLIGPVSYAPLSFDLTMFILLHLLASVIFLSVGYFFSSHNKRITHKQRKLAGSNVNPRLFLIFFIFSAAYVFFSLFDFFAVKDGSLSQVVAMREAENLSGPRNSLIGLFVAILSAAPSLALACAVTAPVLSMATRRLTVWISILGILCTFLSGGRNSFFLSVGFLICYWFLFLKWIDKSNERRGSRIYSQKIIFFIFVALGFVLSMKIFVERFDFLGMSPGDMLEHLSHDYNVTLAEPEFSDSFLLACYSSFVYLVFYLTHALNYLDDYICCSGSPVLMGAYSFPILARGIDLIFDTGFFDSLQQATIGVYLTMPGSLFLDFGYFGFVFSAIFIPMLCGYFLQKRDLLDYCQRISLTFLCLILLASPFYSAFALGNGFSFLVLILFSFFASFLLRKSFFIR